MKIWQKHILTKLSKAFLFLLFSFFLLYFFVDLSVHGVRFFAKSTLFDVLIYYFYTFSTLFDLFITLAFLLATMRVLFDLNSHQELVALQMASISKKRLLTPFFLFAFLLSISSYINCEYFSPKAQDISLNFKTSLKNKKTRGEKKRVHSRLLKDESEIVYQSYDSENQDLLDVYWIRTADDIWHMKSLNIDSHEAKYVNHLVRVDGQFTNFESAPIKTFENLPWDKETIMQKYIPLENRPLSRLAKESIVRSTEHPSILSHLYHKLLAPLLPFLVLLAIAPLCLQFSRNRPYFLIGAAAIFSFIAIKVILDGMLILGENRVLSPTFAILTPILLMFTATLFPFLKMR